MIKDAALNRQVLSIYSFHQQAKSEDETMCNEKEKKAIHNFNRLLVCLLSCVGMLMDGAQAIDLPYFVSLLLWLSLPEFDSLEEKLISRFKKRPQRVPSIAQHNVSTWGF